MPYPAWGGLSLSDRPPDRRIPPNWARRQDLNLRPSRPYNVDCHATSYVENEMLYPSELRREGARIIISLPLTEESEVCLSGLVSLRLPVFAPSVSPAFLQHNR